MSSSSESNPHAVTSSTEAYTKVVLHCLKYPTQPVFGLLIGKRRHASEAALFQKEEDVIVLDAVPLFHTTLLSAPHPLIDVGVQLVQTVVAKDECEIVGLYVANERVSDASISPLLTPVLQHLQHHVVDNSAEHSLLIWVVDNQQLTVPPKVPCMTSVPYTKGAECPYINGKTAVPSASVAGQAFTFVTGAVHDTPPTADELDRQRRGRMAEGGSAGAASAPLVSARTATSLARVPLVAVADLLTSTVASHAHHFIEDFEDHLENPTINFVNQPLHDVLMKSSTVKAPM